MKVLYVAGPYRARTIRETVLNIRRAEEVAIKLWRMEFAVMAPQMNTALFDGAAPDSVWLEGALELMRRCDAVVLVPGWTESAGTRAELTEAEELGIPVFEWPVLKTDIEKALAKVQT